MYPLIKALRARLAPRRNEPKPPEAPAEAMDKMHGQVLKELRNSRRVTIFRTLVILPFAVYAAAAAVLLIAPGFDSIGASSQSRMGIVRVEGVISSTSKASASAIVDQLRRAFEDDRVRAIVLAIDSPGGSPVEAERIGAAIELLQSEHPKPVFSLIGNLGASAAYMVALNGQKIYSHRYSLVGSIGAVIQSWNVKELADRLGVKQTAYTSGRLKAMLSPFAAPSADSDAKANALVRQAGASFMAEVRAKRGTLLKPGVSYDTGEVWRGEESVALGLTDGFATLETLAHDLRLRPLELAPQRSPFGGFAPSLQALPDAVARAVVQQLSQPAEVHQY